MAAAVNVTPMMDDSSKPELFKWHGGELIFIPVLMAGGLMGNALVLYIAHCRWPSSLFAFFIKVLAWLDMSNLVIAMPSLLWTIVLNDTPYFLTACHITTFVAIFTATASVVVLVVIAINRFRRLCHPHKSQITMPLAKKLVLASFVLGLMLAFPSIFLFGRKNIRYTGDEDQVTISYCFCVEQQEHLPLLATWAGVLIITFLSAMVSLGVLYSLTVVALRHHSRRMSTMARHPSTITASSKLISSQQHTMVFFAVTLVFIVSYCPYSVALVVPIIDKSLEERMNALQKTFFDFARLFPLLNNVANPIIYSFTSNKFKVEVKQIFMRRTFPENPGPGRELCNAIKNDTSFSLIPSKNDISYSSN